MENKEQETLKERESELYKLQEKFDRSLKLRKLILFISVSIATIFVSTLLIILLGDKAIRLSLIISTILCSVIFCLGEVIVYSISPKLKKLDGDIKKLLLIESTLTEINKCKIPPKEKVSNAISIILLCCGILLMFSLMIIGSDFFNPFIFVALLLLSLWLVFYSIFVLLTKYLLYSLYYPTVCLLLVALPPYITALITVKFAEWILILSTCLASCIGIILLSLFLYFTVMKPNKIKTQFLINHERDINIEISRDNSLIKYFFNKKGDKGELITNHSTRFKCVIYKNNGELEKIAEKNFVEQHNAHYYIFEILIELWKSDDGRNELRDWEYKPFDADVDDLLFNANIKSLYESLTQEEYFKNIIEHRESNNDEYIIVEFNKYLDITIYQDTVYYNNTHFHPYNNDDILMFLKELLAERFVFVKNIIGTIKQYPYYKLDKLLKKRTNVVVFSAKKIYKDNSVKNANQ